MPCVDGVWKRILGVPAEWCHCCLAWSLCVCVSNGIFVTLETAARRVVLSAGRECYVLDSIGIVKDLPFQLCDAFAATVKELQAADLVLRILCAMTASTLPQAV